MDIENTKQGESSTYVTLVLSAVCALAVLAPAVAARRPKAQKATPPPAVPVAAAPDFADWTKWNYKNRYRIETGKDADGVYFLSVHGTSGRVDKAWSASSPLLAVPENAREFVVSIEIKSGWALRDHGKGGDKAENAISWFDADGKQMASLAMRHVATGGSDGFECLREWGKVPEGAKSCKVKFGFLAPDLKDGEVATYRAFSFETVPEGESRAAEFEAEWKDNAWLKRAYALRGDPKKPTSVPPAEKPAGISASLRDDGFAIVNGKLFFPIGVYNVKHADVNSNSLDRAFADLKAAGFNMAQTYADSYNPEFLEAAAKHDMKLWVRGRPDDERFLNAGRYNPQILAWYLGDDSSRNVPPLAMRDRNAAVKAIDPARLTCQADSVKAAEPVSQYAAYVPYTDVFMPEIYPVYGHKRDPSDTTCVARVVLDMKKIANDVRQFNDGRPRACWPIIQYFLGWNKWFHFPSREQLFAMTWASVVHGANGVMYYIYNGTRVNKKTGFKNSGITETPETWKNISDLVAQLNEWAPVIMERTPKEQPTVEIVEGQKFAPLGVGVSVACLYKVHDDKGRLMAVNICAENVTAKFTLPGGETFTKQFAPFEVLLK